MRAVYGKWAWLAHRRSAADGGRSQHYCGSLHWWRSGNKKRTQNVSEYMLVLALCLVYILRCAFDTATPRFPTTASTLSCSFCSCFCVRSSRRLTTLLRYSRSTPSPAKRGFVRRGFYLRPDEPADISLFIGDFCAKDALSMPAEAVFSRIPVSSLLMSNHAPPTYEGLNAFPFITFRVSRRRREMYCGHARLGVCVSVCPRPHAYTIARTQM